MSYVTIRDLRKQFGNFGAVNGLNLTIQSGELISLLGPSGCGKTTTLRLVAGLLKPDGGEIRVGDRVVSSAHAIVAPEKRRMSMIFQSYAVWPHKTVFENVAYGLQFQKLGGDETRRRVTRILEVVRLGDLAKRYPGELSGGQQQRVALARALVVEPEVLLLDEPLSNLDANLREEMRFEIRRLHDEFKITSVYVTHDQAEAMVISDRVAVMNRGLLEQLGAPEEIYEQPATRFVAGFIGQVNLLDAESAGPNAVRFAGIRLPVRTPMGLTAEGAPVVVAVRPSELTMRPVDGGPLSENALRGRVLRHSYLGGARDYVVMIEPGDHQLRVITPAGERYSQGEAVQITAQPTACRVLPG